MLQYNFLCVNLKGVCGWSFECYYVNCVQSLIFISTAAYRSILLLFLVLYVLKISGLWPDRINSTRRQWKRSSLYFLHFPSPPFPFCSFIPIPSLFLLHCILTPHFKQWRIQKFWKGAVYQPRRHLSQIHSTHDEIYAFYTGKGDLLKKNC